MNDQQPSSQPQFQPPAQTQFEPPAQAVTDQWTPPAAQWTPEPARWTPPTGQWAATGAPYAPPGMVTELPGQPFPEPPEQVARGLLFSLGGVAVGIVFTAVLWHFGIQWAFTSFVLAAAAVYLYRIGAGTLKKGVVPLIVVILAGTAVSFFACVALDAYDYWTSEGLVGSPVAFILDNIFAPEVLSAYTTDIVFFVLFAALGMFSTLRGLLRSRTT